MDLTSAERNPDSLRNYIAAAACNYGKLLKEKDAELQEKDKRIADLQVELEYFRSNRMEQRERYEKRVEALSESIRQLHENLEEQLAKAHKIFIDECCFDCWESRIPCIQCGKTVCDRCTNKWGWDDVYCTTCYDKL